MGIGVRRLLLGGLVWLLASVGVLALSGAPASAFLGYGNRTSVFGAHVNLTTGENVCTAASGDECGPGEPGSGDGQFLLNPETGAPGAGVAVDDATHDVYVTDTLQHRIEKFTASGTFIAAWGWGVTDGKEEFEVCTAACQPGLPGEGLGQLNTPVGVAVDNSGGSFAGDVYVADRGSGRIEKFSSAGVPLGHFGQAGDPGSTTDPSHGLNGLKGGNSVFVDPTSGDVWVADGENERAVEYEPSAEASPGTYLAEITGFGNGAFGLTVDSSGNIYVINGAAEVSEFSASLAHVRDLDTGGEPRAIVTNPAGEVFIGDRRVGYRVLQYPAGGTGGGSPSQTFGSATPPIAGSTGLALDPETETIYVADGPDNDVELFALVQLATLTTGSASNVRGTAATIAGTVDPEGTQTHYFFEYGTSTAYGSTTPEETSSQSGNLSASVNLSELAVETTYHYRIVATTANGLSAGADATFTTGPAVAGVATLAASSVAITTAMLNGRLNPEEGVETHYFFQYGTSTEYGVTSEPEETSSTGGPISATASLTGLTPGTTYHYRIFTASEHGITAGQDETFTTSPAVPAVDDQAPFATGVAPHEATLNGTVNPGQGITTYHFLYGPTVAYGSSTPDSYTQLNFEDDTVQQLITGLAPDSTYHYALVASNSSGTTTGPDQTFSTLPETVVEAGPEQSPAAPELPATLALPLTSALLPAVLFPLEQPGTTPPPKSETRAQKLAKALRACAKQPKKRRAACVKQARKRYGPARRNRK